MKAYDYWLASKYMEHVADAYTLDLLSDKNKLDCMTDELDLHVSMRYLVWRDFASRARQFRDYIGMSQHMQMLSDYIKSGQEVLALKAIQAKAREMRQIIMQSPRNKWRR